MVVYSFKNYSSHILPAGLEDECIIGEVIPSDCGILIGCAGVVYVGSTALDEASGLAAGSAESGFGHEFHYPHSLVCEIRSRNLVGREIRERTGVG